jgi:neuron navigator 2
MLREKEIKLTDIRLEALATAHQLDQTKEENVKIKIELEQLKCENVRMQQILNSLHNNTNINHLVSSPSPSSSISSNNSKSMNQVDFSTNSTSSLIINNKTDSGKRVLVSIFSGDSDQNPLQVPIENQKSHTIIGSININTKTNWESLDQIVKSLFKDYLNKLDECDEISKLGLGSESIHLYYVGDMVRYSDLIDEDKIPDLLPYGYLVGDFTNIIIKLKDSFQNSIDSLCYDTLVPKNVLQRYISLLLDYKNLLFCGPNGTNKSYIARKLAEHLVKRQNKDIDTSIAYFDVENKSCQDLKQYLNNLIDSDVSDDFDSSSSMLPSILILDNLQHCKNMSDTFLDYFNKNSSKKWYLYLFLFEL